MIVIRNVTASSSSWPCPRCSAPFVAAADRWPFDVSDPSRPVLVCVYCAMLALPGSARRARGHLQGGGAQPRGLERASQSRLGAVMMRSGAPASAGSAAHRQVVAGERAVDRGRRNAELCPDLGQRAARHVEPMPRLGPGSASITPAVPSRVRLAHLRRSLFRYGRDVRQHTTPGAGAGRRTVVLEVRGDLLELLGREASPLGVGVLSSAQDFHGGCSRLVRSGLLAERTNKKRIPPSTPPRNGGNQRAPVSSRV